MTEELHSNNYGLLKQLEHILERDALIDEVGFIHPSQFATLGEGIVSANEPLVDFLPQPVDEVIITSQSLDINDLQQDTTIFWSRDHKLAISTQALLPLYKAAKHAFTTALEQYKRLISLPDETAKFLDEKVIDTTSVSKFGVEDEVMRHSKALLLLSCDYGTAWNSRKLVVSKKRQISLFMNELMLSALILSYAPKSEHAWSHRRWAIKTINGTYPDIQDIVERDSELVKKIAEKSKMNYRAWSHRCWLITHMTSEQVINELNKSKKWAELHVADNSCFHYRQHLLHTMTKHSMATVYSFWMGELEWNLTLIKRYIGREALWLHRRFLFQFGYVHFSTNNSKGKLIDMDKLMDSELGLLDECLSISDNEFEDGKSQRVLAASYILWVFKQLPNSGVITYRGRSRGELKILLKELCPEKTRLWDDLIVLDRPLSIFTPNSICDRI